MSDVRVVITGLGVVTNCGIGIDETFETRLSAARCGFRSGPLI